MNLTVKNGSFSYNRGKTTVFRDINFSVGAGEILAILGPNGAGKTTLLRCITGMLRWTGGESLLDGEPIRSMAPRKLWSRMAYVPQAKAASAAYTAFETVLLGRSSRLNAFETPGDADVQKAREVMELLGIFHLADKSAATSAAASCRWCSSPGRWRQSPACSFSMNRRAIWISRISLWYSMP